MKNDRNQRPVGANSASYNAKHPVNSVRLGLIRAAKRRAWNSSQRRALDQIGSLPRPALPQAIRREFGGSPVGRILEGARHG